MKTLLITGGSRGIGLATVKEFLNNKYRVITTSTSGNVPLQNENLLVYQLDLGNSSSITDFVKKLNNIKIDVLINNAGTANKDEERINIDGLRRTLDVNVIGMIDLTTQLLPLININGIIINISSDYGSLTDDWGNTVPSYRIAKAAINMFTRNYYDAKEVKSKSIKVYSFDPGWVKTDMGGPDAERDPEDPAKELLALAESGKKSGLFYRGLKVRDW
jgi:NAD(P)-dependent dehydrogenase (short-subunit alcohol dehydrogenase family)